MVNHCSKCGAFVSRKRRYAEGRSTNILTICFKCNNIIAWPFIIIGGNQDGG